MVFELFCGASCILVYPLYLRVQISDFLKAGRIARPNPKLLKLSSTPWCSRKVGPGLPSSRRNFEIVEKQYNLRVELMKAKICRYCCILNRQRRPHNTGNTSCAFCVTEDSLDRSDAQLVAGLKPRTVTVVKECHADISLCLNEITS